jgi:2-hydroxychromene-2-carboxylate isomerase
MPRLEFWYDFASHYAYLSAMRIEALASARGVEVAWRPFLLGPIFKAQGWDTSPFQIYPVKGAYTRRDVARLADARGLKFRVPDPFPQNSIKAARIGLVGQTEGWLPAFTKAIFVAEFADLLPISEPATLTGVLDAHGLETARILVQADRPEIKQCLREHTEEAVQKQIFGAPTFVCADGELFWGDDRLEQALDWAVRSRV